MIDVIYEKTELNKKEIKYAVKLLNTLLDWIIVKRFTINNYERKVKNLFRFDDEKTNFLWELFVSKRTELINIVLLNNINLCNQINEEMNNLVEVFSSIFDQDDIEEIE